LNEKRKEYNDIPAENIAAEVDAKIRAYQKKYNILIVLNDNRSGKKVDPELQFESQKIIRDLWEMGFSYEKVIELLGLEDDFANYRSTVENQTESSSSSSTAQTRRRPATVSVPQETSIDLNIAQILLFLGRQ
jgi:DNA-binding transcriptional MerR regulator